MTAEPPTTRPDRRLAAILAADIVGYSRMMEADTDATVRALEALRLETLGPVLSDHRGEVVKSMGDGWLVRFASSVNAVNAAMQIQDRLAGQDRLRLRMGIHIGDVTQSAGEIYGDGINIAARLESLAPPGGVLISDAVHSGLDGTLSPSFRQAGDLTLKNITRPVTAWVRAPEGTAPAPDDAAMRVTSALPALSIHPVATADDRTDVRDLTRSLTADLHTYFGGITWLRTEIRETAIAGSYTLRASLRTSGTRLRLETRLTAPDGASVWAHKSNGSLDDSFDWQDAVAAEIAGHVTDLILEAETLRLSVIPDDQLKPEHCLLLGMMAWRSFSSDSFTRSTAFHERAFTADPTLADAYAEAIIVVCAARTMGASPRMVAYQAQLGDWIAAARPMSAGHAMLTLAIGIATYQQDQRAAPLHQCVEQVLRLAPFDARVLSFSGWARLWAGQTQDALSCFEKSIELGKLGPFLVAAYGGLATACIQLGRLDEALRVCDEGLKRADTYPTLYSCKAAAQALFGDLEAAAETLARYRELQPTQTLAKWRAVNPYGGSEGGARYFEGLRLAGLPLE